MILAANDGTRENLKTTESPRNNPFPGLRPFEPEEDHLFFGREAETDMLLRRLRAYRFVSVLGTSGSGKSSLVRCGLIPSLHSGFMVKAGSSWRVAILRPGADPIGNLAVALNARDVFGVEGELAETNRILLETTLRRSALGLVDCVRHAHLREYENLLVVVDQFEELFRFKRSSKLQGLHDHAVAFVKLLLAASGQRRVPVYVVITMRSDFIGDCMSYPGLPDAINTGQFLVPLMTREELRAAITGPVAVAGGKIETRLVTRLLNEVGDDPDQLPVLQHALMQTWNFWEAVATDSDSLDLAHYEATGTMAAALSRHADEAYRELNSDTERRIAERMFKALTDRSEDKRGVRRPTAVREIAEICAVDPKQVIAVADVFRRAGRSFLVPPAEATLNDDSILDLSHESLMRRWRRLIQWVDEETAAGKAYLRLSRAARRHRLGQAGLWVNPELALGLEWLERSQPNEAWARRHDDSFDQSIAFLAMSRRASEKKSAQERAARQAKLRRARALAVVLGSAALITSAFGIYAWRAGQIALEAEQMAKTQAETAGAVTDFLIRLFEVSDPGEARGNTITARELLDTGAQKIEGLRDQPELQARLMDSMGLVYRKLGLYSKSEPLLEKAVAIRRRALGADDPSTLTSMNKLASLYWSQGRYEEGEALYVETLQRRKHVLGSEHANTLRSMSNLAQLYSSRGRYKEAERLYIEALEAQRRILGADHRSTLRSLRNLANLYWSQGRYDLAEEMFLEVLETRRVVDPGDPDTLRAMIGLSITYTSLGRYDEAESLLLETLEKQQRVHGSVHPDTAATLYNLASIEAKRGDSTRAFDWLARSIDAGFAHADHMHQDPDLESLHGPDFDALVAQARANADAQRAEPE